MIVIERLAGEIGYRKEADKDIQILSDAMRGPHHHFQRFDPPVQARESGVGAGCSPLPGVLRFEFANRRICSRPVRFLLEPCRVNS